ncbi:lymphocyte antigen 6D [Corythoichthys intestinalis]|uniref:lymphocyte antigen 6D n=1 Tax=Corythoichthys intestinalis TaxID=161448 RepID=UPI0025A6854F|nr:lymphocyte antigen 6D [Corythoichthys intestinalis]
MKVVPVLTLLFLLLCSTQVLTLECYSCVGSDENECNDVKTCKENELYCKTTGSGSEVHMDCSETCVESSTTTCCQTNLC